MLSSRGDDIRQGEGEGKSIERRKGKNNERWIVEKMGDGRKAKITRVKEGVNVKGKSGDVLLRRKEKRE